MRQVLVSCVAVAVLPVVIVAWAIGVLVRGVR